VRSAVCGGRKAGGGCTYYDFMQNRHFDIAGPNPAPEELKQIDHEYTGYLDVQRRDAIAAALAKKHSDQIQADLEKAQPRTGPTTSVGPPMVITPTKVPPTGTKASVDRSRATRCDDGPLSCSWSKFSATLKNAFGPDEQIECDQLRVAEPIAPAMLPAQANSLTSLAPD
jgi:hypothetical protein